MSEHHMNPSRDMEGNLLRLIRDYEEATGWRVTKVDYNAESGRVVIEALPR